MKSEPDRRLLSLFEETKSVPERDPKNAARGRANFLRAASELRAGVSTVGKKRLMGWNLFNRKEKFAMNALLAVIVTLVMLAGGGLTVYAAQDDLPNQPLFGVKTMSEDIGLALTSEPTARMERLMQLSQRRVNELAGLAAQGESIPAQVTTRLEQHIEASLQIAAGQNDTDMQASLLRIRAQLQTQEQLLNQLHTQAGTTEEPELEQARQMIQNQLRNVDGGLADPQQFRYNHQHRNRVNQVETPTVTPTPETTLTPQPSPTTPGGYGPGPSGTPHMGTPMPNGTGGNNPNGTTPPGNNNGGGTPNDNGTGAGGTGGGGGGSGGKP